MRRLNMRFGASLLATTMILAVVGVAGMASAGHNVCITDPEDFELGSGTCGDEDAWVQAEGDRSGLKYCFNTRIDGDPATCEDNMGGGGGIRIEGVWTQ